MANIETAKKRSDLSRRDPSCWTTLALGVGRWLVVTAACAAYSTSVAFGDGGPGDAARTELGSDENLAEPGADGDPAAPNAVDARVRRAGTTSLDERAVIRRAVADRPTISVSRLALEAAERRADGLADPVPWRLDVSADYQHSDTPIRDAITSGLQIRDTFNWSVSLFKAWTTGTEALFVIGSTIAKSETPLSFDVGGVEVTERRETGPFTAAAASIRVTQHLLKGREMATNELPERVARRRVDAAQLALEEDASNVVLETSQAFWDLRRAQREVELRNASLGRIDEQREITLVLIDAGTLAPIELDVLAQQRVVAEEGLLLAEANREQAALELSRTYGAPNETPWAEGPDAVPPLPTSDEDALVELAQKRSFAVRALEEQIAVQQLEVERLDAELEPVLDVFVQVTQQGLDDDVSIEDGFGAEAFKQVFGLEFGTIATGVVFSINLDDARAESDADASRTELNRLQAQLDETRAIVETAVRRQRKAVDTARARLDLAERSVVLAERNLTTGRDRFEAGRLTTLELLRIQEELDDAEARLASSRVELITSTIQLEHAVGTLLERHGVEVADSGEAE